MLHYKFAFPSFIVEVELAHSTLGVSFIGTDPPHQRHGCGSLLLQRGLDRSKSDSYPAYLESTIDAGPLYERHRFKAAETLWMVLDGTGKDGAAVVYEEMFFIFRPSAKARTA